MENNKLIAEFIGIRGEYNEDEKVVYLESDIDGRGVYAFSDMKYHTSWDWLMPVIRQINEVSNYNDYCKDRLHLQRVLDDCINENAVGIDEVYKAVVEFIKEYNK